MAILKQVEDGIPVAQLCQQIALIVLPFTCPRRRIFKIVSRIRRQPKNLRLKPWSDNPFADGARLGGDHQRAGDHGSWENKSEDEPSACPPAKTNFSSVRLQHVCLNQRGGS
jgi:hypothetical protein